MSPPPRTGGTTATRSPRTTPTPKVVRPPKAARSSKAAGARTERRRDTAPVEVVTSQVEPRIVERRRTVERAARRRRTRLLVVVAVVIGCIAAVVGSTMSPLLDVDRITVVGNDRVGEAELLDASGVRHGDRLVDLDADAARRSLMAIPWVASARVVRDWPDAVRISVTEERPVASVVTPGSVVLVSTTGRVLERLSDPAPGAPRLESTQPLALTDDPDHPATVGAGATSDPAGQIVSDRLQEALAVFERVPEDMRGELSLARMADDGTLSFELSDGAVVRFGPPEDVAAKMLAVQAVLTQVVRDCMATLDVREPTRAAVSRGPGCPGISPETATATTGGTTSGSAASSGAQSGTSTGTGSSSAGTTRTTIGSNGG